MYSAAEEVVWFAAGHAFQWDGIAWSTVPGLADRITTVAGSGADDVWFAGTQVHRWNGADLSSWDLPGSHIGALRVFAPDDAWALSDTANHWDGSSWTSYDIAPRASVSTLWGPATDDLWAVDPGTSDKSPEQSHWDGTSWQTTMDGLPCEPSAVWGGAANGWLSCSSGSVLYSWTANGFVEVTSDSFRAGNVAGDAGSAFAASDSGIEHWNGQSWRLIDPATTFVAMDGVTPDSVLVGGTSGEIAQCTAVGCDYLAGGPCEPARQLHAAWHSSEADLWAVGDGILHWDGCAWTWPTLPPQAADATLWAISGTAPDDIWAAGGPGLDHTTVLHYDGSTWSWIDTGVTGISMFAIHARTRDDVWLVGGTADVGVVLHFNGNVWTEQFPSSRPLWAVWVAGLDDVWVAGEFGTLLHWDGLHWTNTTDLPYHFQALWGAAPNDVWAGAAASSDGGDTGRLVHWDGYTWQDVWSPTPSYVTALGGSARDDIWAAGRDGLLLHWNGLDGTWSAPIRDVVAGDITALSVSSSSTWLVSGAGVLFRP